jgi:hypothetical protein
MSESQLKKLKAEKDRLEVEAETVKELITVSNACQELFTYIHQTGEPFDAAPGGNPFTKKIGSGGCALL